MVKRFTDTDLWGKEWFIKLPDLQRNLFFYIKDNCDCAGVYEPNYTMLSFIFRAEITKEQILEINKFKHQIEFINGKFFLIDFCDFQYGKLKETCKPHIKVIETLKKHGLFERVSKGYPKGIHTLEEKDKEKEKEKEEEKEKDKEKNYGEYQNVHLNEHQYGKLLAMCASQDLLNELINSFSVNIEVGKERPYTAELPNAHFERLKSYYTWRKKNPEGIPKQTFKTKDELFIEAQKEQIEAVKEVFAQLGEEQYG